MKPERPSERAFKTAQEAKIFQEAIEKFGPGFEKRWKDSLRRLAAEEVEQAFQNVMREAQWWDQTIKQIPSLYAGKETLVEASHNNDRSEYYLKACAEKRREGGWIYLPVKDFKNLIPKLKASILDGQRDKHLHMTAQQLIYIEMYPKITDIGYVQVRRSSQTPEDEKRRKDNNESISRKSYSS